MSRDLVVHLSFTPVSGSPIQIVKALSRYSKYEGRLVNAGPAAYGKMTFDEDLVLPQDHEEALDLIHEAKIIHLHQCIRLENNEFKVNFNSLKKSGKIFVRQWHSEPDHFARVGYPGPSEFEAEEIPQMVIGQYHERYYPRARIVPNIILNDNTFESRFPSHEEFKVVYSPTSRLSTQDRRWATKGYPETIELMLDLKRRFQFNFTVLEGLPWIQVMREKGLASIVLDDLVTGSYHRSALEGIMLGKPTITYLDQRAAATLSRMTGTQEIPFVVSNLRMFPSFFKEIFIRPELIVELGEYSRNWFNEFYSPDKMIKLYEEVYDEVIVNGGQLVPKHTDLRSDFLSTEMFDLVYKVENGKFG